MSTFVAKMNRHPMRKKTFHTPETHKKSIKYPGRVITNCWSIVNWLLAHRSVIPCVCPRMGACLGRQIRVRLRIRTAGLDTNIWQLKLIIQVNVIIVTLVCLTDSRMLNFQIRKNLPHLTRYSYVCTCMYLYLKTNTKIVLQRTKWLYIFFHIMYDYISCFLFSFNK